MTISCDLEPSLSRFEPLLPLLHCPESHSDLKLISINQLLERLSEEERAKVPENTVGAFICEDSQLAYPILGRIADFLPQDVLHLEENSNSNRQDRAAFSSEKQDVKRWYDEYGWKRNSQGVLQDTANFSQDAPTAFGFYEQHSHLSLLDRFGRGEFLLDAASGAIAHPEYLTYSWFHRYRVCVDFSLTALLEADAQLGNRGFCCMADICKLPFREGVFAGVVSGYTIQHVPENQQHAALGELFRVVSPGHHVCVMTGVQPGLAHRVLLRGVQGCKKILRLVRILGAPIEKPVMARGESPPHSLDFYPRSTKWWRYQARLLTPKASIESLRLFHKDEFELHFEPFGAGRRMVQVIRSFETMFPRLLASMSNYVVADLRKP